MWLQRIFYNHTAVLITCFIRTESLTGVCESPASEAPTGGACGAEVQAGAPMICR